MLNGEELMAMQRPGVVVQVMGTVSKSLRMKGHLLYLSEE